MTDIPNREDNPDSRGDNRETMATNAALMSSMTLLSRVTGLLREMLFASLLGATQASSAFAVAITLPNRLRQVFAEGAMSAAFIPMMAEAAKRSRDRLLTFVQHFLWSLVAIVLVIVLCAVAAAPALTSILAPAWRADPPQFQLTVRLMQICFPYLLLVSLYAFFGAFLNYHGRFALPAAAPACFNITILIVAYALARSFVAPAYAFVLAWLVAGVVQAGLLVRPAKKIGISLRPRLGFADPLVRQSGWLVIPRILGYGAAMINEVVAQQAATGAGFQDNEAYPTHLYFAIRLTEFVLGGFATSVATVILPTLSRQATAGRTREYLATVVGSLRAVAFITIPATAGLIVLRRPLIATLLERGKWDAHATVETGYALAMYATGLFTFAAGRILIPAYYSRKDTWTPLIIGFVVVLLNAALIRWLVEPLRQGGIALALSIAGFVQLLLLLGVLRRRLGPLGLSVLAGSLARILVAALLMGGAVYWLREALPQPGHGELFRLLHLAVLVLSGAISYAVLCYLLRCRELFEGRDVIRQRLARRKK